MNEHRNISNSYMPKASFNNGKGFWRANKVSLLPYETLKFLQYQPICKSPLNKSQPYMALQTTIE